MKKVRWVSATAGAALVAAMFALPGAGVAYASDNGNTTGNGNISILSGNTVTAPVSVPVNLCGISLAVAGFSNAGCAGGSSSTISNVGDDSHNGNSTGNFNIPIVSGNTVTAPVSVPVNVCGNAVAAGGFANANCKGGSTSCIGNDCNQHECHGPQCHECHGPQCHPCQGDDCHCMGQQCHPCHGNECHCMGNNCHPCEHNCGGTPPGCTANCGGTPPGCTANCGGTPPGCTANCGGTPPGGTSPGGTTTTVSTGTAPSGGLPTTGADLLLLGVAALGSIGVGAGAVAVARRRRNGEA